MPNVPKIPLPKGDRWLRATEIAEVFGVSPESVHRWRRAGKLKGYLVAKAFWFKKSDVNAVLVAKGLPTI